MDQLSCSSPLCIALNRWYSFWAGVERYRPWQGSHWLPVSAFTLLHGSIFSCCIQEGITTSDPQLNQLSGVSTNFDSHPRCRREPIPSRQHAPHWPIWMHFLSSPRTQVFQFASPKYSAAQNPHSTSFFPLLSQVFNPFPSSRAPGRWV